VKRSNLTGLVWGILPWIDQHDQRFRCNDSLVYYRFPIVTSENWQGSDSLLRAARRVREEITSLQLPLATPGSSNARIQLASIGKQLDDHVLPRIEHLDAPALVVVGGSTGAGKSLIVNSVVGSEVSRSGVLRPTTRSPVLVHHPTDTEWFANTTILPELARVTGLVDSMSGDIIRELRLVKSDTLPDGIAVLDAPDIDSIDAANRAMAAQLLAAADVWIFVTTAARYADAVPWGFLHMARDRGTPLVVVLNRVPPNAMTEIEPHLSQLLHDNGLVDVTLFGIEEQSLHEAFLTASAIEPIRSWLVRLGADSESRAKMVRQSLKGSVSELMVRTATVADLADTQSETIASLRKSVDVAYSHAHERVQNEIRDGAVLRGEVLARWQEFVGTGELLRQLRTGIGRLRDRVTGVISGRPKTAEILTASVEGVVETMIHNHGDQAAAETIEAWKANPAVASVLDGKLDILGRSSAELPALAAKLVREWQGTLLDLVRTQGADRRSTARFLSFGVNGVSMVLMVLVFSHTGGLTGGEVAIAGGTSAVGHALLESLLGDENLRRLASKAREDLDARVTEIYATEKQRFFDSLDHLGVRENGGDGLRSALLDLQKAIG
jgi:hypothetical protein